MHEPWPTSRDRRSWGWWEVLQGREEVPLMPGMATEVPGRAEMGTEVPGRRLVGLEMSDGNRMGCQRNLLWPPFPRWVNGSTSL